MSWFYDNPALADLRPRVVSPDTGDAVLLDEYVLELFSRVPAAAVQITGPEGCGKTTALRHLVSVPIYAAPCWGQPTSISSICATPGSTAATNPVCGNEVRFFDPRQHNGDGLPIAEVSPSTAVGRKT